MTGATIDLVTSGKKHKSNSLPGKEVKTTRDFNSIPTASPSLLHILYLYKVIYTHFNTYTRNNLISNTYISVDVLDYID